MIADEFELMIRETPEQWHLLNPNWPSDYEVLGRESPNTSGTSERTSVCQTRTMRIGIICPYSLTLPGGVQMQVLGLARALRKQGSESECSPRAMARPLTRRHPARQQPADRRQRLDCPGGSRPRPVAGDSGHAR